MPKGRKRGGAVTHAPARRNAASPDVRVLPAELMAQGIEVAHAFFAGPLPPPDALGEYDMVIPGLADRVVRMAEDEARHRQRTESRLVRLSEAGLASAFVLAGLIAGGGLYAAVLGAELTGVAAVMATVSALVSVFLVGQRGRRVPPPRTARAGTEP